MKWSSAWTLDDAASIGSATPGRIQLSAGLDRVVEIDGLFDDDIEHVRRWAGGAPIDIDDVSRMLLDQLVGLGVLIAGPTEPEPGAATRVGVACDPASTDLATRIAARLDAGSATSAIVFERQHRECVEATPVDMLIALRIQDRIDVDQRGDRPIVHVDLRHEHTLVVGPIELPGISACDTCYDTRLARRWRVPHLPARPGVLDHAPLASEVIAFHTTRFLMTGTHLVNATIAHSFRDGSATVDALLRVPSCSGCGPTRTKNGQVRLPWHPRPNGWASAGQGETDPPGTPGYDDPSVPARPGVTMPTNHSKQP